MSANRQLLLGGSGVNAPPYDESYAQYRILWLKVDDGSVGPSTFLDSSVTNNGVNTNGRIQRVVDTGVARSVAMQFNGADSLDTAAMSSALEIYKLGLDDFMLSFWVSTSTTSSGNTALICYRDNYPGTGGWSIDVYGNSGFVKVDFITGDATGFTIAEFPRNEYHHVTVTRHGDKFTGWLDGKMFSSWQKTYNINASYVLRFGKLGWQALTVPMRLAEVELVRGIGVRSLALPNAALPLPLTESEDADFASVMFALDFTAADNSVADRSYWNHVPSVAGGTNVTDPQGLRLRVRDLTGNQDIRFSVGQEAYIWKDDFVIGARVWVPGPVTSIRTILASFQSWSSDVSFILEVTADGKGTFWAGNSVPIALKSDEAFPLNQWVSFVVVRYRNVVRMYINGQQQSQVYRDAAVEILANPEIVVGSGGFGGNYCNCYVESVYIKRSAENFVPSFVPPFPLDDSLPVPAAPYAFDMSQEDALWEQTAALLHFDGAQDSTVLFDEVSQSNFTAVSGAKLTTATSRFGGSCLDLTTADSYAYRDSATLNLSNTAYTVEAWIYPTSNSTADRAIVSNFLAQANGRFTFGLSAMRLWFSEQDASGGNTQGGTTSETLVINEWQRVALTKASDGTYRLYIGDQLLHSGNSPIRSNFPNHMRIGRHDAGIYAMTFYGLVDELRITKAVRTFVPLALLTGQFPGGASLRRICYWNEMEGSGAAFVDAGPFALGHTAVTAVQTTEQPATGNSSGDFRSGVMDVVTDGKLAWGLDNFAISCWVRIPAIGTPAQPRNVFAKFAAWPSQIDFVLEVDGEGHFAFWAAPNHPLLLESSFMCPVNRDVWVAVVRHAGVTKLYVDGKFVAFSVASANIGNFEPLLSLGYNGFTGSYLGGWVDQVLLQRSSVGFLPTLLPQNPDGPQNRSYGLPGRALTLGRGALGPSQQDNFVTYGLPGRKLQLNDTAGRISFEPVTTRQLQGRSMLMVRGNVGLEAVEANKQAALQGRGMLLGRGNLTRNVISVTITPPPAYRELEIYSINTNSPDVELRFRTWGEITGFTSGNPFSEMWFENPPANIGNYYTVQFICEQGADSVMEGSAPFGTTLPMTSEQYLRFIGPFNAGIAPVRLRCRFTPTPTNPSQQIFTVMLLITLDSQGSTGG
jgi:hypothetical protein